MTSDQRDSDATFETERPRLRSLAGRMLGDQSAAEDVLQDAWLRLERADTSEIENLPAWLSTVVSRLCIDELRRRSTRGELPIDQALEVTGTELTPEEEVVVADAVGSALSATLDELSPPERLAFVLHDAFALPFADVARVLGISPDAARQHASRGRRKVRMTAGDVRAPGAEVVEAFSAASRAGEFDRLVELLAPDVVFRTDSDTPLLQVGAPKVGGESVADFFKGRAHGAEVATIDGAAGLIWAPKGSPVGAFEFVVVDGRIAAIELVVNPATLAAMEINW